MVVTKTSLLRYNNSYELMTVKSFIVQAPGMFVRGKFYQTSLIISLIYTQVEKTFVVGSGLFYCQIGP